MNNEPVAYVTGVKQFDPVMADTVLKVGTPLYTHPAKTLTDECYEVVFDGEKYMTKLKHPTKPLADEEIDEIVMKQFGESRYDFFLGTWRDFARAILRKAQEK